MTSHMGEVNRDREVVGTQEGREGWRWERTDMRWGEAKAVKRDDSFCSPAELRVPTAPKSTGGTPSGRTPRPTKGVEPHC